MSGLFGSSNTTAAAANSLGDLTKDITLNNPPDDSISDLSFSPVSNHLAVASWDSKVRIYEINAQGGEGKALYDHQGPVLSTHWSSVCSSLTITEIGKNLLICFLGWQESSLSRRRQGSEAVGFGIGTNYNCSSGCAPRSTYSICSILHPTKLER